MHSYKTSAYSSVPTEKLTLKEFMFLEKVLFSPAGYYYCGAVKQKQALIIC